MDFLGLILLGIHLFGYHEKCLGQAPPPPPPHHIHAGFVQLRENLETGTFLKKIMENLENSGNFRTIFTTSGKTQGILFCQISLPSSLGHLATNQSNVLLTGTLTEKMDITESLDDLTIL